MRCLRGQWNERLVGVCDEWLPEVQVWSSFPWRLLPLYDALSRCIPQSPHSHVAPAATEATRCCFQHVRHLGDSLLRVLFHLRLLPLWQLRRWQRPAEPPRPTVPRGLPGRHHTDPARWQLDQIRQRRSALQWHRAMP